MVWLDDRHQVHLGKFASRAGAGIVMTEAAAVVAEGRITHGDLGIWHDGQVAPLARIAISAQQRRDPGDLSWRHAGRKASDAAACGTATWPDGGGPCTRRFALENRRAEPDRYGRRLAVAA